MTAPELKPCPFCGGRASISKDHDTNGNGAFYAVKCHKCRAKSSEIYAVETCNIHFTQVRDAWNRRADLAAIQPAQVTLDDQERNYLHLHNAAFDVWRWFETARPDLIGTLAEKLRDAVIGPRPFGCIEQQPDPRDEVIARLVEALVTVNGITEASFPQATSAGDVAEIQKVARAALAAAKTVQHG